MEDFIYGQGTPGDPDYSAPIIDDVEFRIKSDHLTEFAGDVGLYFNLPLSSRFALGSKLLVGRSIMQEIDLDAVATGGERRFVYDSATDALDLECHGASSSTMTTPARPTP